MLIHPFTVLATAVTLAAAVAGAPFPLSSLMNRKAEGGMPAFTKIPYRRVPHRGRKHVKRQIEEGLEAFSWGLGYAAEISIGTPPQRFWAQVDTGSSDLWVYGPDFVTPGDPVYYPGNSSTSRKTPLTKGLLSYGSETVLGDQYVDTVSFANFPIDNFTFFAVNDEQPDQGLARGGASGLLGLGSGLRTNAGDDGFMQSLLDQQGVESVAFSFALQSKVGGQGPPIADGGVLTVGTSFDNSQYVGQLYTINQTDKYGPQWVIPFDGGSFNNHTIDSGYALIDSGTTLIAGPSDVVDAIYSTVPGAFYRPGNWFVPCNASFSWYFTFGGVQFPLGPQDLVHGSAMNESDPNLCAGALFSNDDDPFWILGDYFMRNYFVGFTYEPNYPAISFAELPQGDVAEGPTTAGIPMPTATISVPSVAVTPLPPTSFSSPAATESGAALATTKAGATRSVLIASSTSAAGGRGGNGKSNGAMATSVAGADWLALLLTTVGGLISLLVVVL